MAYWFIKVCFLSLAGSGAMLAVWTACRLGGQRLSCRWQYYVWLLPLILFLLPVTPPQAVSAPSAVPAAIAGPAGKTAVPLTVSQPLPAQTGTAGAVQPGHSAREAAVQAPAAVVPVQKMPTLPLPAAELLGWIWLAGILLLLVRHGVQAAHLRRFLRRGTGAAEPWEQDLLEARQAVMGLRRPVSLRRYAGAGSPFLSGLLRPAVYLPEPPMAPAELEQVFTHELTHCRRRDLWVKQLAWLVRTVHWFNPLAWLLEREVDYRCELACDEAVVREWDSEGRRAYGLTLIKLMRGRNAPVPGSAGLAGRDIKTRLEVLMQPVQKQKGRRVLAAVLALCLCLGTTALAAEVNAQNHSGIYQATQVLDLFYVDWLGTGLGDDRNLAENYGPTSGYNYNAAGDILLVDTPLQKTFSARFTADTLITYGRNVTAADFLPASTFQVEMTRLERVIESRAEWVGCFTVYQDGVPIFTDEPGKLEHIPSLDGTQLTALTVGADGIHYFYARFNFGLSGTGPMDGEAAALADMQAFLRHQDTIPIKTHQSAEAQIDGYTSVPFFEDIFYVNDTLGGIACQMLIDAQEVGYASRYLPAQSATTTLELRPQDVTFYDGDKAAGTFFLSLPNGQDREFSGTLTGLNGAVGGVISLQADDGSLALEFTIEEDRQYAGTEPILDDRGLEEGQLEFSVFFRTSQRSNGRDAVSTAEMPFTITTEGDTVTVRYTGDAKYRAGASLLTSTYGDWYGSKNVVETRLLGQDAETFRIPDGYCIALDLYQVSTAGGADFRRYDLSLYRAPGGALVASCQLYWVFNGNYTGAEAERMLGSGYLPPFMR